jgi:hypothetical protein
MMKRDIMVDLVGAHFLKTRDNNKITVRLSMVNCEPVATWKWLSTTVSAAGCEYYAEYGAAFLALPGGLTTW